MAPSIKVVRLGSMPVPMPGLYRELQKQMAYKAHLLCAVFIHQFDPKPIVVDEPDPIDSEEKETPPSGIRRVLSKLRGK